MPILQLELNLWQQLAEAQQSPQEIALRLLCGNDSDSGTLLWICWGRGDHSLKKSDHLVQMNKD
jgi:hypothetical protein